MTAAGQAATPFVPPKARPWSRIYGLGTVYAKTLRDSRLAVDHRGRPASARSAAVRRRRVRRGVQHAPVAPGARQPRQRACRRSCRACYGNPFPVNIETLGGSIGWKTGASLGLMAALWSVLALSGTLAAEARRGSLEFVATTPLGMRRIAVEKLAAHLTGMAIVVLVDVPLRLHRRVGVRDPAGRRDPGLERRSGSPLWVGVMALASGAVAFALSPLIGRGASAGIAGAILVVGYFVNGYQAAVPAFARRRQPHLVGLDGPPPAAGRRSSTGCRSSRPRSSRSSCSSWASSCSRGATSALTSRVPWPAIPAALIGLRGPTSRSLGERLPLAVSWGIGIGLHGLHLRRRRRCR